MRAYLRGASLADSKTPTPVTTKVEEPEQAGLMSLEDLDRIIAESDPTALKNIEGVREIAAEMEGSIELVDLDDDLLNNSDKHKKRLEKFSEKLKLKSIVLWVWLKSQSVENSKKFLIWLTTKKSNLRDGISRFGKWPVKSKLLFASASTLR